MNSGLWSAVEAPLIIEYSRAAMDEIREIVWDGFQRLTRGGLEAGGILYGQRRDQAIEIQAVRTIACQHAFGPGFVLSENDRAALREQMETSPEEPRPGIEILGWFVSHTRSGIALSAADQEIFATHFPEPWQVTLVVHPDRDGSMRGGFFVREADGAIRSDASYREFNFPERLAARSENIPPASRERGREGSRRSKYTRGGFTNDILPGAEPILAIPEPVSAPRELLPIEPVLETKPPQGSDSPSLPAAASAPASAPRFKWAWLAVWALVIIGAAGLGVRWILASRGAEPISLALIERDGQLRIDWDRTARPVAKALSGSLEIVDGGAMQTIDLSPQDLTRGELPYVRKSGDVEVRMSVRGPDGKTREEASRFLGATPGKKVDPAEFDSLQQQRQGLEAELNRLRGENAAQAERIRELETAMRVLQQRLALSGH